MLYIRMFLTMIVGLYTSRVVLNVLGVEDYGIYGVVGGVVAMLGFLNASMSGATSRFLTFELGRGDQKRLADTFSSALIVHIGIALIVLVISETVGLWFLTHKLVIPSERMTAAHWVFQLSIFSAMLNITQVPYNAAIIAHEKMDIYAYVEILNVTLKLLIVYLLTIGNFDKLILYAALVFAVSVFILMVYRIYCIRHFQESHFRFIWDKSILSPLLKFSWQTMVAHMSYSFRLQGTNFALNLIFGVIVNAASGIAATVNGVISQFSINVLAAFNPQIIKQYSQGNYETSCRLILSAAKYSTLLLLLIIIPFEFEAPQILKLWLGKVPDYTITFNRLMMISLLSCATTPIYTGLMAIGKIKEYSLIQAGLYLICPFIIYFTCLSYNIPELAYIVMLLIQIIASVILVIIFQSNMMAFSVSKYLITILQSIILPSSVSILACYFIYASFGPSFFRLVSIFAVNFFILCIFALNGLSHAERSRINVIIQKKILHKTNVGSYN